jgi:hypothetical protein
MKLRINQQSIRFRLSAEEILRLQDEGYLEETVTITEDNYFVFVLEIAHQLEACEVQFGDDGLNVGIPMEVAEGWINSNKTGISETIDADNQESITLRIEEDLPPSRKASD